MFKDTVTLSSSIDLLHKFFSHYNIKHADTQSLIIYLDNY